MRLLSKVLKGDLATRAVDYPHPELWAGAAGVPREAELVVKDAYADASALRKLAKNEAEELRRAAEEAHRTARDQGFAEGFQQGQDAAIREFEQERSELAAARERVQQEAAAIDQRLQEERRRVRVEALGEAQREMVQLAMAVATKVVRTELVTRQELVVQLIAQALAATTGEGAAQVRVAADDIQRLNARRAELAANLHAGNPVRLEADLSLEAGEFVVQGPSGSVNGRVAAQVAQLEQAAMGALTELGGHER